MRGHALLPEDEVNALLEKTSDVGEGYVAIGAIAAESTGWIDPVKQRVENGFNQLKNDLNHGDVLLGAGILVSEGGFLPELVLELPRGAHVDFYLLLLPPELLADQLFEVLVDFLHHDQSLKGSAGLLSHEGENQLELVGDTVELSASELEVDDPVGNDPVKASLFPDVDRQVLVVPQAVAEPLEEGQHANRLHILEVQQLIEYPLIGRRPHEVLIEGEDLTQQTEKVVLDLYVLELPQISEIYLFELELDWALDDRLLFFHAYLFKQ